MWCVGNYFDAPVNHSLMWRLHIFAKCHPMMTERLFPTLRDKFKIKFDLVIVLDASLIDNAFIRVFTIHKTEGVFATIAFLINMNIIATIAAYFFVKCYSIMMG